MTTTETTTITAPSWATSSSRIFDNVNHSAITTSAASFDVGLARTDDAEGPGDVIVTVSADMLTPDEADALADALRTAAATARGNSGQ